MTLPIKKILIVLLIAFLTLSFFLTLAKIRPVEAQPGVLFSDNFDTNQPNSQFTLGSNDNITNAVYASPNNSLQVSPSSSSPSNATFVDATGQLYLQFFYQTNNTGYSRILILQGNTGWFGIYQDENGVIFDWDYNANITNVLLTPNTWYNITLSLYLDPAQGANSFASLWLNQTLIASQSMPQIDGYDINKITFEPSSSFQAMDYYDDVIVSTQPLSSPIPTSSPTPTSSPIATSTPSPSLAPTPTPTIAPTPIQTDSPTTSPTITPSPAPTTTDDPTLNQTSTTSPTPSPTIPEITPLVIISAFAISSMLILILFKRQRKNGSFSHFFE